MATIRLAQASPGAAAEVSLATVGAGKQALVDISACNKGAAGASIRIAVLLGGVRTYLEYGLPLTAAGTVGNGADSAGNKFPANTEIKVWASTSDVDFTAQLVEE